MNRQVWPSNLFPLRGDVSAEAGATTVLVQGLQGIPIISPPIEPAGLDTFFYDSYNNDWFYASPWDIPVGIPLVWEGYGYGSSGISWIAPDTLAFGNGTDGDVSGAAAMTALVLFGSASYYGPYNDYDVDYGPSYDQFYTSIFSGATQNWNLILPPNPGAVGQVLTTNGTGVSYWSTVASSGGSVTSFSSGNLSPLFTTSVATPTTTPALSFSLNTQNANTVFAGPTSGGAATPTFRSLVAADLPVFPLTINAQVGTSYTVLNTDQNKLITFSNTAATAVTLPQAGIGGQFLNGWWCYVQNLNTGLVTITPTTSTINGWPQIVLGQYQWALIVSNGTNYEAFFTKIASTDAASALSAYLTSDAGTGASQNQIVMQDIGATNTNTKRKGLNVYLETAAQASGSNYDGLQVNVGATITANTSASAGHVDAAEFYVLASGSAVTLPQINGVKIRTSVAASTAVNNVIGELFYLPEWAGTITNYIGIFMDNPVGGGTVTNFVGVYAGCPGTDVTITNLVGLQAVGGNATSSYAITALGGTAGIVNNDTTIAGSFIGHGNVSVGTFPIPLHDGWYGFTGSPEGVVTANVGSMFSRQDSTIGDPFYVKASGSGNTLWSPVDSIGPIKTVVTTYSTTNSDSTINANGTFTITLASTGVPTGKRFYIKNIGTGVITVSSAVNIDGALTATLNTQYQAIIVQWDGTQWWIY